jgi:hypothetical protein
MGAMQFVCIYASPGSASKTDHNWMYSCLRSHGKLTVVPTAVPQWHNFWSSLVYFLCGSVVPAVEVLLHIWRICEHLLFSQLWCCKLLNILAINYFVLLSPNLSNKIDRIHIITFAICHNKGSHCDYINITYALLVSIKQNGKHTNFIILK